MKHITSKPSLTGSQLQLGDLLVTNKQLAKQKRQAHRQRLRIYSQKAVKIKTILKQTNDKSERKCLESKLQVLKLKQDAQITKLAKIEQIQKEIDQYIDEESESILPQNGSKSKKMLKSKSKKQNYEDENSQFHNTPSQKWKKYDTICRAIYSSQNTQSLKKTSDKKGSFSIMKYQTQQWNNNNQKRQKGLRQLSINELVQRRQQQYPLKHQINEGKNQQHRYNSIQIKSKSRFNSINNQQNMNTPCEEQNFQRLKSKTNDFSKYLSQQKIKHNQNQLKLRIADYEQTLKDLKRREQRQNSKLKESQRRMVELIDDQRRLMERIDTLQKQEDMLSKRVDRLIASINKSMQIILESAASLNLPKDPIKQSKQSHDFSIESFESFTSNPSNRSPLIQQLHSLQKILQQYLLAIQRQSMLAGCQLQQINLKLARSKQQYQTFEVKKKGLQNELLRLQQYINKKKIQSDEIHKQFSKIYNDFEQFDSINKVKHDLSNQLQDKNEKLKNKKKLLTQKLKKLDEQLQNKEDEIMKKHMQGTRVSQNIKKLNQQYSYLKHEISDSEELFQKRKRQIEDFVKIQNTLQNKVTQSQKTYEELVLKIKENQMVLSQLFMQISQKYEEQNLLSQRSRKLQIQLSQSVIILDEQNSMTFKLSEQIKNKSFQLQQINKKITQNTTNLHVLQDTKIGLQQKIKNLKVQTNTFQQHGDDLKKLNTELQQILGDVMSKKQTLMSQIQLKSRQLQKILQDMQSAQEDIQQLQQMYNKLNLQVIEKGQMINALTLRINDIQQNIEQNIEQENNVLMRMSKIKELQKIKLIQIGIKGVNDNVQGVLRDKVKEIVSQLSSVQQIKNQLKDCKYQNRRLRLDNQRLQKLIAEDQQNKQNQ